MILILILNFAIDMKLVFASNNKNKIAEIQQQVGSQFEIVSLEDIGCFVDIQETAETIEGNAILKANYVTENFGLPCFTDDTPSCCLHAAYSSFRDAATHKRT